MKKLLILLFFFSNQLLAAGLDPYIGLGGVFIIEDFSDTQNFTVNDPTGGITVKLGLAQKGSYFYELQYLGYYDLELTDMNTNQQSQLNSNSFGLNAGVSLVKSRRLNVYSGFGLGYNSISTNPQIRDLPNGQLYASFMVRGDYELTNFLSVELEANYTKGFGDRLKLNYIPFIVGFKLFF